MNCQKCGTPNVSGEKFCKNCGCILENPKEQPVSPQSQQFVSQQSSEQPYAQTNMNVNNGQNMNGNLNSNYVQQAVNPDMKKWAILSIVVPVVAIIWYWFIGLTFYLAILIAAAGFGFAQKGEMANKKMAIVGKVLNGILCAMAFIMLILQLIEAFAG